MFILIKYLKLMIFLVFKMDPYLKEIEYLQKLHDEVNPEEFDLEGDSDEENDVCIESDHFSDTEEEIDECDEVSQSSTNAANKGNTNHLYYTSKNDIKWKKHCPATNI